MNEIENESKESNILFSDKKLVLGINSSGDITWFNRECEKFTRYNRGDVITKKLSDFLIPRDYTTSWMKLFENVRKDKHLNEVILPILTKDGEEIPVSWDTLTIGDRDEIIFVGAPISKMKVGSPRSDGKSKKLGLTSNKNSLKGKKVSIKSVGGTRGNKKEIKTVLDSRMISNFSTYQDNRNIENNRNVFDRKDERKQIRELKQIIRSLNKKISKLEDDKKDIIQKMVREIELFQKEKKEIIQEMQDSLDRLRYEKDKVIRDLIKKNKGLEKELEDLKRKYDSLKDVLEKERNRREELFKNRQMFERNIVKAIKNGTNFLINCVGGKEKKEVFYRMAEELEKRRKALDVFEKKLREEAEVLSKKKEEFVRWREKLEELEKEIEHRREELVQQEKLFDNYVFSTLWSVKEFEENSKSRMKSGNISRIEFNKIDESAVVLQRNILKQVNQNFQTLLGYDEEDVVDRSLSEIVAPESLPILRRYYLNRLKGEANDSFEMIFLTKDREKISVEVTTQPTLFNGENADILILTPLNKKMIK